MENMYPLKSCTVASSPQPLHWELADCWGTYIAAHTETFAKLRPQHLRGCCRSCLICWFLMCIFFHRRFWEFFEVKSMSVFCTGDVTSLYEPGEKYKVLPNSAVFYLGLNVLFFSNIFSSVLFSVFMNNIFVSIPYYLYYFKNATNQDVGKQLLKIFCRPKCGVFWVLSTCFSFKGWLYYFFPQKRDECYFIKYKILLYNNYLWNVRYHKMVSEYSL